MRRRLIVWGVAGAAVLALAVFAGWILSLPPAPPAATAEAIPQAETQALIDALKPPKRQRPVIAVIGVNDGTETTDYLMPYGILRRSGVADVMLLATDPGPVTLYPALTVEPHATIAEFDARYAEGADYVIVPAMRRDDDPAALAWIRRQAEKGAIVIGVCAGAKVVAEAGLLDGRQATTHWYYLSEMLERRPAIRYVADRRFVADRKVVTTTGVSASMPMSLSLIEAIAGRAKAEAAAREAGLEHWDARHRSEAFTLTRPFALTVLGNVLAFWRRETVGVELPPGFDEVSVALIADAWSRTYRSRAVAYAAENAPQESRNGVRVIPDLAPSDAPEMRLTAEAVSRKPAEALDRTLAAIAARYGARTRDLVAMQLEYSGL